MVAAVVAVAVAAEAEAAIGSHELATSRTVARVIEHEEVVVVQETLDRWQRGLAYLSQRA